MYLLIFAKTAFIFSALHISSTGTGLGCLMDRFSSLTFELVMVIFIQTSKAFKRCLHLFTCTNLRHCPLYLVDIPWEAFLMKDVFLFSPGIAEMNRYLWGQTSTNLYALEHKCNNWQIISFVITKSVHLLIRLCGVFFRQARIIFPPRNRNVQNASLELLKTVNL